MPRTAPSSVRGVFGGRIAGFRRLFGLAACLVATAAACGRGPHEPTAEQIVVAAATAGTTATAAQIVAAMQAQSGSPLQPAAAQSFKTVTGGVQPQFPSTTTAAEKKPASVVLPATASGVMSVKDTSSSASVGVSLSGALASAAQTVGGYLVYPSALANGAALVHRAVPSGTEDLVYFAARPAKAEVDYTVSLGTGIAGLRQVGGVLEFLDATGAPLFHVSPPFIVAADGTATDGALAVKGCAVDSNPSPPWGRAVTSPGASTCTVAVTWPDAAVTYPATLDPRWTTTGSMATARFEHTLTLLSTGNALAVGGRSTTSSTTSLASAELYNPGTGTWASTGSLAHARRLHTATQLGTSSNSTTSGKILVAGGISGTASMNTAELYSPSAGTWAAAGTMDAVRHGHTATLLTDGRVLTAGGYNGTTVLQSASLYNPASGSGSWVATTGPIPPPGLVNHTATLIQTSNSQLNNHVLLVGGNNGSSTIAAVYLFDPTQNAFSTLASISSPREQHMASTLQNTNGKILVAGGKNGSAVQSSAIVFDPGFSNGSWSSAGTMTTARVAATMTLLPNTIVDQGQVLVAGGSSTGSDTLASAELFSNTSTWTGTAAMPSAMKNQAAVLLSGNMVLLAGGLSGSTVLTSAFLYDASFGLSCTSNSQCASGFCTNGVCCDAACNSGTCSACNVVGHLGTCSARIAGTVCRASVGVCDVAETCNGSSFACPADGFQPSTTVCRAPAGECDIAETCTGTGVNCPSDSKKANGTACTDDGNPCTADQCDGTGATCQHPAGNAGVVCRASAGSCDVAETCTGSSTTCPADAFRPSATVCRPSTGQCDVAETCTGNSASCPADGNQPNGTNCSDGNACTQTDTCQSGVCSSGTPVLFGVPESDPTATKCSDGTFPVGCRGFDCTTGQPAGWLANPVCSQSVACTGSCPASGCIPQNQRGGSVVQCDCSCPDPTGGAPLTLSVQACGGSTTSCADLCSQTPRSCATGNCFVGACAPVAGASPVTVLAGSCRSSDNAIMTVIAPYTGAIDPSSSTVVAHLGGRAITSAVSGTVGFSPDASPGVFALTSLQAQITGPIQFFGRQVDALQVNLRRPLFGAEVPNEAGSTVTLGVQPDDLAARVVVGGVAQFLSLDGVASLTANLSSDRSLLSLSASQTQPSGDSVSVNLTAVITNSPPKPTIAVSPGTTLECTGNRAASATFNATVVDPNSGDTVKRVQWFVRDQSISDGGLAPLGTGSSVTASLPLGQLQISAVAYDQHEAAGQSAVIVQVRDTTVPVVTAPPDQTFYAGVGGTSVEVNLGNATIQEACDPHPRVSVVTSQDPDSPLRGATIPSPGDVVLPVGRIPIIWAVTDVSGNTASATQTVTVLAQDPPPGTPPPAPITIPAPACTGGATPVSPPNSSQVSIELNVCIVGRINAGVKEGSAPWENCQGQDDPCTDTAIQSLLTTTNMLFGGFVNFHYNGFQRIADPYPPAADGSEPTDPFPCTSKGSVGYGYGDLCLNVGLNDDVGIEGNKMLADCYARWGYPPPNARGDSDACQRPVTLLLVRGMDILSQDPQICGVGTAALSSATTQAVCMDPRNVANNTSGAFAIVATEGAGGDTVQNPCQAVPLTIAHELGHALGLGHGDGLDDDCDGVWDSFCQPNESEVGPSTLMNADGNAVTSVVTPLQLDRTRVFATKSVQAGASSTSSCPATPVPPPVVDTKAPFVGCGCRVGEASGSIWALCLLGLAIFSRRRPRSRR